MSFGRLGFSLSTLLLGGCASVAHFGGVSFKDSGVYVSDFTPVKQDAAHACGPACVASVAAHWGVGLEEFRTRSPRLSDEATGPDLQALAEKLGLQAFVYQGSFDDLEENLSKGRPLIAMIPKPVMVDGGLTTGLLANLWNEIGPKPAHWVVVVGFNPPDRVIIHDPTVGLLVVERGKFKKWWAEKENLCVLIAGSGDPSSRVAATANPAAK